MRSFLGAVDCAAVAKKGGSVPRNPCQVSELSLQMQMLCIALILLSLIPNYRKHIIFTLKQTSKQKTRTTIDSAHPSPIWELGMWD